MPTSRRTPSAHVFQCKPFTKLQELETCSRQLTAFPLGPCYENRSAAVTRRKSSQVFQQRRSYNTTNAFLRVSCSIADLRWASPTQGSVVPASDKEEQRGGTDRHTYNHRYLSEVIKRQTDRQTNVQFQDKEQDGMKGSL